MSTHQVTVEFRGISTHFRDTVPGVPHRVVLPRSSAWNAGYIRWPGHEEDPKPYFLPPHFSYLYCKDEREGEPHHLHGPGVRNSWIHSGVRLQIANAIGPPLDYSSSFGDEVPKVASYVPGYQYSDDVVLGGRAACYFDVFCGTVVSYLHGNAWRTTITMETDGPPQLQITPLRPITGGAAENVLVRPYVVVGNSSPDTTDASLDFLWHLLTCREGIPQELAQRPYGYGAGSTPGLQRQAHRVVKLEVPYQDLPWGIADIETDASCSNSQYP